jgi:hypothetical protein
MAAPINFNWSFTSQIDGGPQFSASKPSINVSAYDYVKQTLPAAPIGGSTNTDVHLQPNTAAMVVVILSDQYSGDVAYQVDGAGPERVLDAPHLFLGAGAVGYLSAGGNPQKLTFNNKVTATVNVQVFVGRSA